MTIRSIARPADFVGVNIALGKLMAFGLAAFIAGIGSALTGYTQGELTAESFAAFASISLLAIAFVAGVGRIAGAVVAGVVFSAAGLFVTFLDIHLSVGKYQAIVAGVALVLTAVQNPDGLTGTATGKGPAVALAKLRDRLGGVIGAGSRETPGNRRLALTRPGRLPGRASARPLGIGTTAPRLSWWLPIGARRQLAYRIRADNGWDSGRVEGHESVLVGYDGPPLRSAQRVGWQVKVWTDLGESAWSEPHAFEPGLLEPHDWSARWIVPIQSEQRPPAGGRRCSCAGSSGSNVPVVRARLHATAHGIYEAFINGARVGDAELTPGYTEYRERLQVQAYDVTDHVRNGRNAIGAILSDGWFRGQVGLARAHDQWGSELAFLAELRVEFADGFTAVVCTGDGWRTARSEIEAADLIAGESVDLRLRSDGWSEPGFDDSGWGPVRIDDYGYANLVCSPAPPVRPCRSWRRPACVACPVDRCSISARTSTAGSGCGSSGRPGPRSR